MQGHLFHHALFRGLTAHHALQGQTVLPGLSLEGGHGGDSQISRGDVLRGEPCDLGQLGQDRLPAQLGGQLGAGPVDEQCLFLPPAAHLDHAVVPEKPPDFPGDLGHGIGGELGAELGVKPLHRF